MKRRWPCSATLYLKVKAKSANKYTTTGKCTYVRMFKNVHFTREKREICLYRNQEWRQSDIGKTSNDARILTLLKVGELFYRLHTAKGISMFLHFSMLIASFLMHFYFFNPTAIHAFNLTVFAMGAYKIFSHRYVALVNSFSLEIPKRTNGTLKVSSLKI